MNVITNADDVERIVTLFERERREDLLVTLRALAHPDGHPPIQLGMAIGALIGYIGDPEVARLFNAIEERNS